MMDRPALILASGSPRRRAMLSAGDVAFSVMVSEVEESKFASGPPRSIALKTALAKADAVAQRAPQGALVLAADTIVTLDGAVYGKPADRAEARAMLQSLAGRQHRVITGVALQRAGGGAAAEALVDAVAPGVTFFPLTEGFIDDYLASGEADDKAGAYGIQGLGARLVERVEGDLTGVIGLPLGRLAEMYRELTGLPLFERLTPRQVAGLAFAELGKLPAQCLEGIPDRML